MHLRGTASATAEKITADFTADYSQLMDSVLDSLSAQIAVVNTNGIFQKVNRAWYIFNKKATLPGYSQQDFTGISYLEICAGAHSPYGGDTTTVLAGVRSVLSGKNEAFRLEFSTGILNTKKYFLAEVISLGSFAALIIHTDITERKADEKWREQFFAIASHELKMPITSLKGIAHIFKISFEKQINREGAKLLAAMDIQLNKLTKIIDDVLLVNTRPDRDIILHKEFFSFSKLVRQTVQNVRNISPLHFLTIEENERINYTGDKFRLEQVITNLLINSVKYSPQANHVIISTVIKNNCILFSVRDFGIGIEKENFQKIFERFYRVDNQDRFTGAGLGLYICSKIIEAHQGNLWVESEKGSGSIFYFTLPLEIK